ncbi:MAG: hypothetical protein QM784_06530 [Polyangiaceae bacterium]
MQRTPLAPLVSWAVRTHLSCVVILTPVLGRAEVDIVHRTWMTQERAAPLLLTPTERPTAFSQQSCNTDCQERQTDCALRCDQDAPCIRRCRAEAEDCTRRCVRAPEATPPAPAAQGLSDVAELDVVPRR